MLLILISPVIHFRFDLQPGFKPKIGAGDRDETVTGLLENLSFPGLGPQWIRPLPPRLPVQYDEVRFWSQIGLKSWSALLSN